MVIVDMTPEQKTAILLEVEKLRSVAYQKKTAQGVNGFVVEC